MPDERRIDVAKANAKIKEKAAQTTNRPARIRLDVLDSMPDNSQTVSV